MILTSILNTVSGINEAWLRESLKREASDIYKHTDTHMEVYNNKPNHFTIVVDDALEYMLDTTEYTAELKENATDFNDENVLLAAIVDDGDNFEDNLAISVIMAIYQTL